MREQGSTHSRASRPVSLQARTNADKTSGPSREWGRSCGPTHACLHKKRRADATLRASWRQRLYLALHTLLAPSVHPCPRRSPARSAHTGRWGGEIPSTRFQAGGRTRGCAAGKSEHALCCGRRFAVPRSRQLRRDWPRKSPFLRLKALPKPPQSRQMSPRRAEKNRSGDVLRCRCEVVRSE